MLLDHPLAVITPTVDGDVLHVLARADSAFTTRQVTGLLERYSYSGVRKVLDRLVSQGIVIAERVGTADVYRLNREHLAAGPIIELSGLQSVLLERIRTLLGEWSTPPVYAALFGSGARGGMHVGSDIDLFVVRPALIDEEDVQWLEQISQFERHVTMWTGNDARVLEYSDDTVRTLWSDESVLESVRNDGITLFGSRSYWGLIERGGEER